MTRRPKKVSERREMTNFGEVAVPTRIITEYRRDFRASVTQHALIIRVPAAAGPKERSAGVRDMKNWANRTFSAQPKLLDRFRKPDLADRYLFDFRGTTYHVAVGASRRASHRISRVGEGRLAISLNLSDPRATAGGIVPKLLAKYFGGRCLPEVTHRVEELNAAHFRRPINAVKLSDTYSRWGSCSSNGNINLATRLLLAPPEVLDAVIIHELAHLVEANHSPRFWAEVARALPDHKTYDAWLRDNGSTLTFHPRPLEANTE